MKNSLLIILIVSALNLAFWSCDKMEDNYSKYLEEEKIYSPRISNLRAYSGLQTVSMAWDNPDGDIAKYIFIDYQDSTITTDELIDSITIENLLIKGYTIEVYTVDAYGNLSVPAAVNIFPNGESN